MSARKLPMQVITPQRISWQQTFHDFQIYHELIGILVWREINVRYKQTSVGIVWVILQPLLSSLIFAVLFGSLGHLPSDGMPYLLYVFSGVSLWNFFSHSIDRASLSIIQDERLVSKVYFPPWIIPLASVLSVLLDFSISLTFVSGLTFFYGFRPGWQNLLIIPVILVTLIFVSGLGLLVAALSVRFRDFRYMVPFLLQLGLFSAPVFYSTHLASARMQWVFYLNPMSGLLSSFRYALTGLGSSEWLVWSLSAGSTLVLAFICLWIFHLLQDDITDNL